MEAGQRQVPGREESPVLVLHKLFGILIELIPVGFVHTEIVVHTFRRLPEVRPSGGERQWQPVESLSQSRGVSV